MTIETKNISEVQKKVMKECFEKFIHRDCKEITMDGVAKAISMSKRTIYEKFVNKEDMLGKTLKYYTTMHLNNIEFLENKYDNPFMKLLEIFFNAIYNISQINISKIEDLKKFYPNIAFALYEQRQTFLKGHLITLLQEAINQKYIIDDLEPEYIINIIFETADLNVHFNEKVKVLDTEYDRYRVHATRIFLLLKGMATEKGLVECEKFFKSIKENEFKANQ